VASYRLEQVARNEPQLNEAILVKAIAKFYYAGACARWMFLRSTWDVIYKIDQHVNKAPDIVALAELKVGDRSNVAVNHLLSYRGSKKALPVSLHAARTIALQTCVRLDSLTLLRKAIVDNKAVEGWIFQTEFLTQVCARTQDRLENFIRVTENTGDQEVKLPTKNFGTFQTETEIDDGWIFESGSWFIPSKPRHAGYDAACVVEGLTGMELVFIQLTVGKTHALNEEHLMPLVNQVQIASGMALGKIEMLMVLKKQNGNFKVPKSEHTSSQNLRTLPYAGHRIMFVSSV